MRLSKHPRHRFRGDHQRDGRLQRVHDQGGRPARRRRACPTPRRASSSTSPREKPIVTDGPYGETHELFNGFWIIEVSSKEEAAEWASRAPLGPGSKLEVRRVTDESDFADFADNEYIQKETGWREQLADKSQGN